MAVPTEFYPEIFLFEIQKKHGKHLKIQKIFWICLSNTIYKLIMAELNLFLQYEASIVKGDFCKSLWGYQYDYENTKKVCTSMIYE